MFLRTAILIAGTLFGVSIAAANVENIETDTRGDRPVWWPYDPVEYPSLTTYQKRNLYAIGLMNRIAPVPRLVEGNTSYVVLGDRSDSGGTLEPFWRTRVMTDRWIELGGYMFEPTDPIHRYIGMNPPRGQKTSLLSDRLATVRILGGWMRDGDGPHQDVVERAADGSLEYHWDRLYARLDPIVNNGIEPFVVLDNVPYAFVSSGERNPQYGQNLAPEDYAEWGQFIADLCQALVDRYGFDRANSWWYRFGTEMDNENHWESGAEDSLIKYLKTYDFGTAGLRSVLPDAPVGPCNFNSPFAGRLERLVPAEEVFRHITTGTNFATGEIGAPVDFISISVYGVYWMGRPYEHPAIPRAGYNPSTLRLAAHLMKTWRNIHPRLNDLPIMVMEHGMLINKHAERGMEPGAFGGAWTAMQYMIALEEGIDEIFHWQDYDVFIGPTPEGPARRENIPTSMLWIKYQFEQFVDSDWIPARVFNASHSDYLHAMAFHRDDALSILYAGYNPERSVRGSTATEIRIPKDIMPKGTGAYQLRFTNLVKDNSPFDRMHADLKARGLAKTDGVNQLNRMADQDGRHWIGRNRDVYKRMFDQIFRFNEFPGTLTEHAQYYALNVEIPVPFTFIVEITRAD